MLEELDLAYDDGDVDMRGGRHRRRRSRRGRSAMTLLLVVALLAALGGGGYAAVHVVGGWFAAADYSGSGHGSVQVQVQVGQGAAEIGNTLFTKHVVKSAKAFVDAAEDNPNSRNIQPGFYRLHQEMRAELALAGLLDQRNRVSTKVTIPEGWTTNRVLRALSDKLHQPLSDFQQAIKDPESLGIPDSWYEREDHKKATRSVEGFLYPTTYQFDPGTSAKDALAEMVQQFMAEASKAGLDKTPGMTPFEALIVASMVQAEGIDKDMPKVARVVYNRLSANDVYLHKLQFDSTTNYWLDLHGKGAKESRELTRDQLYDSSNPYSTHAHAGLPPGPIENPGPVAMAAAAQPADGNWLYFVRIKKDGTSAFTDDYAVQQRNQEKAKENGAG